MENLSKWWLPLPSFFGVGCCFLSLFWVVLFSPSPFLVVMQPLVLWVVPPFFCWVVLIGLLLLLLVVLSALSILGVVLPLSTSDRDMKLNKCNILKLGQIQKQIRESKVYMMRVKCWFALLFWAELRFH